MVGTRVQNIDSFHSIYICPHCLLLLRDPVQLVNCGHHLCQSCADEQHDDIIICAKCHDRISRMDLKRDRGFENDMKILIIFCAYCDWKNQLKDYPKHLNDMHANPTCEYCEQKFVSINDLNRHQQYDCEKITIYCPFRRFGCEGLIHRIKLNEHYRTLQHQLVLINIVHNLKSTMETQLSISFDHTVQNNVNQSQEINDTMDILSNSMVMLKEDLKRLSAESSHHQTTINHCLQDLPALKISIQEQNSTLDATATSQEMLQTDIKSMEEKINNMTGATYDGTYTWKIENIRAKIDEARTAKQLSIYSLPFYSSPSGYKMCLRIYLNGDGNGRGTHVSLFFVLMRGEYDAILKFPFHFKIIFCLLNQIEQKNHIIDSFRPDSSSSSFQRPRSVMNIASGIPKFVPLSFIEQENSPYIRDDTMFIKVMVDFWSMPKSLLPYVFTLNPALTSSIQQEMIRQEAEKQQQNQSSRQ